jgi:hypothetical protein
MRILGIDPGLKAIADGCSTSCVTFSRFPRRTDERMKKVLPRFSLRLLFLTTTLSAVAVYFLFVRPITLAKAFADRVAAKEYREADLLCRDSKQAFIVAQAVDWDDCDVTVNLEHRDWSDMLRCQQRITLEARRRVPIRGTNEYVAFRGNLFAGPLSIKPPTGLYPITYLR